jgi:hypothetical protein
MYPAAVTTALKMNEVKVLAWLRRPEPHVFLNVPGM